MQSNSATTDVVSSEVPKVICSHCKGTGKVDLPAHLYRILRCLESGREMTTPEIVADIKSDYGEVVFVTAMCNRLRALEQFGLVRRRKESAPTGGYWYLWSKAEVAE